jgi:hypothetical protein
MSLLASPAQNAIASRKPAAAGFTVEIEPLGARKDATVPAIFTFLRGWAKIAKVELRPARFGIGRAAFTLDEMRHNFAWPVKNVDHRLKLHLYYCVRCKQAFSVEDWSGYATPLDSQGTLQGSEAIKRLDTCSCGPCPALSRLTGARPTSNLIPSQTVRGRLTDLTAAPLRAWKAVVAC